MRKCFSLSLSLLFSFCFLLLSCNASAPSIHSDNYGQCGVLNTSFGGDWFDYYKRAITYMDCEKWPEAESDLRQAVSIRDTDKRRVYTLGMHFLNNYFPNRELGIVLYQQHKFDEAVTVLTKSFEQFPSEKARIFLIKSLQQSSAAALDKNAPTITLKAQTEKELSVVIEDNNMIDLVSINDQPYLLQATKVIDDASITYQPIDAKKEIIIDPSVYGDDDINIVVMDVFQNKKSMIIKNLNDITPPSFSLLSRKVNSKSLHIRVEDKGVGVSQIVIDSHLFKFPLSNHNSQIAGINIQCTNAYQIKCNKLAQLNDVELMITFDSTKQNKRLIGVGDGKGNLTSRLVAIAPTMANAEIEIDIAEIGKVTQESSVLLEIYVAAAEGMQSIQIGDKSIALNNSIEQVLNYLYPLKSGHNEIDITVLTDQTEKQHKVAIFKQDAGSFKFAERLKLALFPFDCQKQGSVTCAKQNKAYNEFYAEFAARKRFQVLNRDQMVNRLERLKICEFVADEKCAWEATQLLGSQAMLVGNVIRRPLNNTNKESVEIYAKLIDATSGDLLISFDHYAEVPMNESIEPLLLSTKIHRYFPLLNFTSNDDALIPSQPNYKLWHKMPILGKGDDICYFGKLNMSNNTPGLMEQPACEIKVFESL